MRLRKAESSKKNTILCSEVLLSLTIGLLRHVRALFFFLRCLLSFHKGIPGGSVVKNLPASAEVMGLIPGMGRSSGEKNGNPFQYSCLGYTMDRGAWRATVHGVTKSGTQVCN